jgi:hypothetical protein
MTHNFEVGEIVTELPESQSPRGEGEVVEVQEDGYISVRFANGAEFAFWPHELVPTGKKLSPESMEVLERLDKAIDEAKGLVRKLQQIRECVVALDLKEKT